MSDFATKNFKDGIHNMIDPESIPKTAAQNSVGWITIDGRIETCRGKRLVGTEGTIGSVQGQEFGYRNDGSKVHWRKTNEKIQYFDGTAWQDTVTGLTSGYQYQFVNYSSLAGNFTFAFGLDGIYKMHNANPASFISLYDSAVNFKFRGAIIDKGRAIAWGRTDDRTGLYGSYIDTQKVGDSYTSVTNENLASGNGILVTFSGTLAFKSGNPKGNAFGVSITDGTETFTDGYDGTLSGSAGGTGTINYISGAYSVTFAVAPIVGVNNVKASYTWENSNSKGVTDFRKSSTRLAGEGFILRQDEGGDAILAVNVGLDGAYYSLKSQSAYRMALDSADISPTNLVFRREIGIPYERAATSTQKGVVFINTANPERPRLTLLQQNPIGGEVEPFILFPQFAFENYTYDKGVLDTYGEFCVLSCKTSGATNNDVMLLLDIQNDKVDVLPYGASTLAKDGSSLYMGSPLTETVYQVLSGFDDDGFPIANQWIGKDELYGRENLKKFKWLRLRGLIYQAKKVKVYIDYDGAGFQLVGTIVGTGPYVDPYSSQTIGSNVIGTAPIGGDDGILIYPFLMELKLKVPKFRKRTIKFVGDGYGYAAIEEIMDYRIMNFENKIPARFRQKNYVSLDGETNSLPTPEF